MDIRIRPAKLEFFDNRSYRLTAAQVRAKTGADYVINCVAFNGNFQPVMGLRMDGKTLVLDDDYYGITWNTAQDITMDRASAGYQNYMTFVPFVRDQNAIPLRIGSDIKGSRQRTAVGIYPDGDLWLYAVKSPTKTPEQMQRMALDKGCIHALMLDGGGSTCASSAYEEVTTSRKIPIYLCIWEDRTVSEGISKYSKAKDGQKKLTANFKVSEFACKDGSDEILIADELPEILQKIRNKFGVTTINSGYRTKEYNTAIGGANASQHCLGTAADIVVTGASPMSVAQYAETLLEGRGGIGLYGGFTHVDVRAARARWDSTSGKEVAVDGFLGSLCPYIEPKANVSYGSTGEGVKWVQWQLNQRGEYLSVDGIFGNNTKTAVLAFQRANNLDADGIVGPKTRGKLRVK